MQSFRSPLICLTCAAFLAAGCTERAVTKVTKIEPGADAQKRAQTALIKAKPGEVIEFGEGKFEFTSTLSLDVNNVTIRGNGNDKTILAFNQQGQGTGGEGILVTSKEKFTIEDLAIEDAKGDSIKVNGCTGVTFRKVRVGWTGGSKETNGGYGLYPVLSKDVLIEDCIVREASDAGIYVGQSENIIVRRNLVERNVAGIEIENSVNADVYENVATDNTGGILVFSLPDLQKKIGHHCRVHNNQVIENNHENFAPKGNIVANVPAGTGVMILANRNVEIFDNEIKNNQNIGVSICSYQVTQRPFAQDPVYDPYTAAIYVHDNKITGGGDKPSGMLGKIVASLLGEKKLPAIVYDGVVDESKTKDGALPPELAIRIHNNGDADFVNFDLPNLDFSNPLAIKKGNISRDLKPYEGDMPKLAPVKIAGVK
ncbi:MAG: right-handed parallel beta-helix repeat-containing protein [Planctomycetia bacterium]|nr:right-handed parallel beta-helix repeat-containing protein [Planctomycetia bacterium]